MKVLDKLKNLKLRRWGDNVFTEAKNSNGGGIGNDVFFAPATIQPKYFLNDSDTEPIEIKNYTPATRSTTFFYNKEDIVSLGIEETSLDSLTQVTIKEAYNDNYSNSPTKGLNINKNVFKNTIILDSISKGDDVVEPSKVNTYSFKMEGIYNVYKISNDMFLILHYFPGLV